MGPFRDSQTPSWISGPRTDEPTEPPSQRPWQERYKVENTPKSGSSNECNYQTASRGYKVYYPTSGEPTKSSWRSGILMMFCQLIINFAD